MAPCNMSWRGIFTCSLLSVLHIQPALSSSPAGSHLLSRGVDTVERSTLNTRADGNDTLVQVTSPDFVNIAFASSNGNLYLEMQDTNSSSSGIDTTTLFWADAEGDIYSDYNDRVLHIYSEEAATYGVSRLRLHNVTELPNTSVLV